MYIENKSTGEDCQLTDSLVNATQKRVVSGFRSISLVFPAYNEEENIARLVEQAKASASALFDDFEIIVVNDGSHDRTGEIIDELSQHEPTLLPIHHEVNKGYGATLRTGFDAASKDLLFFSDSDLQFDLTEIRHLMEWIGDHDIVAGYRADRADPVIRRFNAWGWNMLVRMFLGLKIKDIDCAFKLFRRCVFDDIRLESVGAMINTEILAMANWQEMRLKEIPVNHYPRTAGEQTGANIRVILKAIYELAMMRGRLRRAINSHASSLTPINTQTNV